MSAHSSFFVPRLPFFSKPFRLLSAFLFHASLQLFSLSASAADVFEYGAFKLQRYTEDDGLVSAETNGSYKDRHGFLWISTFGGLSRFDGRNFQNFGRESGLTESNVDLLGEDDGGHLFVRTVSSVYQFTANNTTPFVKFPATNRFISAACPAGDGQVWVAYEGAAGLHLLSVGGERKFLPTAAPVHQLIHGRDGEIYVLELSGDLSVLKEGSLRKVYTVRPRMPYQNEGIFLYKDAAGRVWSYGANNRFLYRHQGSALADSIAVPANTKWWQWIVGGAGNLYLRSDNGSVAQLLNGAWQPILTRAQTRGTVYDLREDSDGTLWICSSGGLLRVNRKRYKNVEAASPLTYFTTDEKGQYVLRGDSLLYRLPGAVKSYSALQSKTITSVYVTRRNDVWYCTEEAAYWLPYGQALRKLNTTQTYEGTKAIFRFRRVLEDDRGGVWISSYHGLFYKKGDSLRYYFSREGLAEGAIYTIAIDRRGIFYAAGVHVYALVNNRFQNISASLHLPDEISRVSTDADKNVWVCQATDTVVKISVDGAQNFYRAGSLTLALNDRPFTAATLCFDAENNLWICDNRSLYCYRSAGSSHQASPLFWAEEFSGSPLLYAGGGSALSVLSHPLSGNYLRTYDGSELLRNARRSTPQVALTAVRLFKENFDWNRAGYTTNLLGVPKNLRLQPQQNFLRFSFAGLTPDFNSKLAYRYRLKGYEADWSPATERGEAEYTGLPAGNYTFEVQARSAGGDWSAPLAYSFAVNAVWYLAWWAKVLWALLIIGLVAAVVYYRQQNLRRKARIRQQLVEEQLKALRAQINPHFLQNTFAFLAHELYAAQNVKAVKAIDALSGYLRDVLRYSDKAAITLEEELAFAERYLQMQQQLLSTAFVYRIRVSEAVDVFDVQVPSMLLQPLLENALKYGLDPNKPNLITLSVEASGHHVKCVISDGGNHTARPASDTNTGKGIALTTDRMKLFYGPKKYPPQFTRHANERGGCDVTLLLPIE